MVEFGCWVHTRFALLFAQPWPGRLAGLSSAGRDHHPVPLHRPSPKDPAPPGLRSAPRTGRIPVEKQLRQRPADTELGNLIYSYKKGLWSP